MNSTDFDTARNADCVHAERTSASNIPSSDTSPFPNSNSFIVCMIREEVGE